MKTSGGIRRRLLWILGLAAVAMLVASAVALIALMEARDDVDVVRKRDLPASELALELARVGERLQDRTPALVAARDAETRQRQTELIDRDLQFLAQKTKRLQGQYPDHSSRIDDFVLLVPVLADKLRSLGGLLDKQASLSSELATRRGHLLVLRDQVRQTLGPSILAMEDVIKKGRSADPDVFRRAALAQGPLLEAERLVSEAFAELLLAAEAPANSTLEMARGAFHRAVAKLHQLMAGFPAGLRRELARAVGVLDGELTTGGVFELRKAQLATGVETKQLVSDSRRIGAILKTKVDALVVSASRNIMKATETMGNSILQNTVALATISIAVILLAALIAYRFVVRDISLSLGAVTSAMQRLAAGERGARVPAMERHDEIGDLARVFNVFKEQAFRMETLDRELAEKSRLLLATFDNMSDGFTVFDREGRLVAWNPRYLQLYGLTEDDVSSGVSLEQLLERVANTGARTFTPLGEEVPVADLASGRDRLNREFQVRCTDGHRVELRSNPIPNGGFVTLHMEITERHAMQGQLRQAQKMETVGQLTGGIAHDFNNILGAILGNLTALEPAVRNQDEAHERWRRAMGAVDRATRQVERLLAFSRRQRLEPEVVDLNSLVEGMTDLLEYSLGEDIELQTDLEPDLPPLRVDPGQLENALMNLSINARDAMTGKGRISFKTSRVDAARMEIAVIDNGAGMDQEVLDRVVEPFFTTKPTGKGSGLGLSMVYGFARQSGGNLTIDSSPGQGTRVHILLPVATGNPVLPKKVVEASAPLPLGAGELLLVVDDDPSLRQTTGDQLRGLGYRTLTAANGQQALALLEREPNVELLYTDLVMPGALDGIALARETLARYPELPVLLTSAESPEGEALPAELLNKPVPLERLARAVRGALDKVSSSG